MLARGPAKARKTITWPGDRQPLTTLFFFFVFFCNINNNKSARYFCKKKKDTKCICICVSQFCKEEGDGQAGEGLGEGLGEGRNVNSSRGDKDATTSGRMLGRNFFGHALSCRLLTPTLPPPLPLSTKTTTEAESEAAAAVAGKIR